MRTSILILGLLLLFVLLNDGLLYLACRKVLRRWRWIYFTLSGFSVVGLVSIGLIATQRPQPWVYVWVGTGVALLLLFYFPKALFLLLHGVGLSLECVGGRCVRCVRWIAVGMAVATFCLILYGITLGRQNYKVQQETVFIENLPASFEGFRIVQLSDLHLGSHTRHYSGIPRLVRLVADLNPDVVVFTGDMVNNFAEEMEPWIAVFKELQPSFGKFAVMGNHDYGPYVKWATEQDRELNLVRYRQNMQRMGFHLLNNASAALVRGGDTLFVSGVENWGNPPFPRYGDLKTALAGTDGFPVVLLSHDPSHWPGEIQSFGVPLTLSGHTHAMQLGLEWNNWKWSPSQYFYPHYDGLYRERGMMLNVSRGEGYLGLAGRVGMRPVVTVLTLRRGTMR